ncbi:GIY-YIG nuclease family protein [Fluviicola sp.]|uniref:GIY-YIG nuclease family protein n=1 Tax=Fluviicola sp. TaxID=1917219 RepID=UPI00281C81E1|nr:GIY-YIG nuclease family protein [Fluviicola sp.]
MFYTYVLYSSSKDKFYVGASESPRERLKKHNAKSKGFTNQTNDWTIVFLREFETKSEDLTFEKQIKSWKSKIKIQKLINSAGSKHPDA